MGVIVMRKKINVFILLTIILSLLTSCETAEITDLYHENTNSLGGPIEEINFSESNLKNYQVNGILFYPFIRHKSTKSTNSDIETYYLKLKVYKPRQVAESNVIINNVKIEGDKNIVFTNISKDFNEKLKFINEEGSSGIQTSTIELFEQFNDYNMELIENESKLRVIINVSVEDGHQVTTKNLVYIFEADTRRYSKLLQ